MELGCEEAMADTQKILLFVKCPEPGKVKTRLESLRDKEWVARLYECFVLDMLETLNGVGYARRIVFYPRDGRDEMVRLFGEGYDYQPQEGDDLGGRMKNAFLSAFSEGMTSVVLLGSDVPDLPGSVLPEAFYGLENSDAMLGPTADGGYYLVGFRKEGFCPAVFDDIPWSTDQVFSETMRRLRAAKRTVSLLPLMQDVDTPEDLRDFRRRNLSTPFARSRTMAFLNHFTASV